ncbi:MAG: universal stress protein [Polyangiaceae bacterium]
MAKFKHIFLATDFGDCSSQALQLATELTVQFGAQLTLLHVWELPSYGYMDAIALPTDLVDQVARAAEARMAETVATIQERCPDTRSIVKMGNIAFELQKIVEDERPDLLVLGTHGRHGFKRALLGSVAEKLVRTSPVPVLTVHGTEP